MDSSMDSFGINGTTDDTNQWQHISEPTSEQPSEEVTDAATDDTLLEDIDAIVGTDVRYLCISCSDGKCGSALYDLSNRSIRVIPEVEDNSYESVILLVMETHPNHVIISSKCDPKLVDMLSLFVMNTDIQMDSECHSSASQTVATEESTQRPTDCETNSQSSEELWRKSHSFALHTVPHNLYDFENSKTRILSLDLQKLSDIDFADETQKFVFISSMVDFWDNNTFRSFGALLRFLDKNCIEIQMQTMDSTVEISSISRLYLEGMVSIDRNTYESLQIFQQEWHPSAAKQGINPREGLSLYGLFNCCVSKIGSNCLRQIFLRPTQDIDIIMDRQNTIGFFVEPNNSGFRDNLIQHLKHIKSVNSIFNRLMTTSCSVKDIKTLCDNLVNALRIRELSSRQNSNLKILDQIRQTFTLELEHLATIIIKVVDFQTSLRTQTFEINSGIDSELDHAKGVYNGLSLILSKVADSEREAYGHLLKEVHCVYIPQIGFMTSAQDLGNASSILSQFNDVEVVVNANRQVFFKNYRTKALDDHFGDIHSEITDRQIQIVNRLKDVIKDYKPFFDRIEYLCSKLDALIAMSQTALHYRYTKPNITSDGVIEIIEGRHPLIELVSKTFVANDFYSGGQHNKVKIISGPNACGKSVYLKQICLIVFMAHIGSYVPALRANIPIIDRLFTRLHTPESISMRLSTFMLDLNQMSNATKNATKRSLVVVDEFGKGTQSVDGLSLMAASLNHWLSTDTPHLLVSTHFRRLPSLLVNHNLYDCQTFQFSRDETQMTYLFKLIDGHFNQSIASYIAYIAAIPLPVIERGLQICERMSLNETIEPLNNDEMNQKFSEYEVIATKLLELDINSEPQVEQFIVNEVLKQKIK